MATSNRDIFDRFLDKVSDRQLCSLLTDEDIINILNMYMGNSTSSYLKHLNQDVANKLLPEFYRQDFTGNDILTQFTISQWSSGNIAKSTVPYFSVDGVVLVLNIDYTFDLNTLTFTTLTPPVLNSEIEAGYDFIGEFNDTFTDEEMWLIASGMVMSWTSSKYYNVENFRNKMGTKDFKIFSTANLLKSMNQLRNQAFHELRQRRVEYSYGSDFAGFN